MSEEKASSPRTSFDIKTVSDLVQISEVHLNLRQEVIITTEDKLRLCLSKHLAEMESRRAWIAPLGVFLTILAALITAKFQDVGLEAATWKAVFVIGDFLALMWLILAVVKALRSRSVEDLVATIKMSAPKPETAAGPSVASSAIAFQHLEDSGGVISSMASDPGKRLPVGHITRLYLVSNPSASDEQVRAYLRTAHGMALSQNQVAKLLSEPEIRRLRRPT